MLIFSAKTFCSSALCPLVPVILSAPPTLCRSSVMLRWPEWHYSFSFRSDLNRIMQTTAPPSASSFLLAGKSVTEMRMIVSSFKCLRSSASTTTRSYIKCDCWYFALCERSNQALPVHGVMLLHFPSRWTLFVWLHSHCWVQLYYYYYIYKKSQKLSSVS